MAKYLYNHRIYIVFAISAAFIFLNNHISAEDQIDENIILNIKRIRDKINSFQSYSYKLTNITKKKKNPAKNIILYNFEKPYKVRIEWLFPKKLRGQLAVYSDGVLKAAPSWLPFVIELNPDSKLAIGDFNYPIYDSSLGDLLDQVINDFERAVLIKVLQEDDQYIVYEIKNDTNRAEIKMSKSDDIPVYIEQFDLKGNLVDGGYFEDFKPNVEYPDDFFNL